MVNRRLSDRYQVTLGTHTVGEIYQELLNWNDVATTLVVSQKSGQDLGYILSLKESMSWDAIYKKLSLSKEDVKIQVDKVLKEANQSVPSTY